MSDKLLTGHGAAASTFNVHLDGDNSLPTTALLPYPPTTAASVFVVALIWPPRIEDWPR